MSLILPSHAKGSRLSLRR